MNISETNFNNINDDLKQLDSGLEKVRQVEDNPYIQPYVRSHSGHIDNEHELLSKDINYLDRSANYVKQEYGRIVALAELKRGSLDNIFWMKNTILAAIGIAVFSAVFSAYWTTKQSSKLSKIQTKKIRRY